MKKIEKTMRYLSLGAAVLVLISMMLPVLTYEDTSFYGHEIVFGQEILSINPFNLGTIASAWLPFSWIGLLAFSLPALSSMLVMINKKYVPISLLISLIALFLMISLPDSIKLMVQIGNSETSMEINWRIAYGFVVGVVAIGLTMATHFYIFVSQDTLKLKT